MKVIVEFEVEDLGELLKKWNNEALPDETWYIEDGAYQKKTVRELFEERSGITEYQISMSNSHGVYEFDWSHGQAVVHYGSWGVTEVSGAPKKGIEEKKEIEFSELPEIVREYAKERLDLPKSLVESTNAGGSS